MVERNYSHPKWRQKAEQLKKESGYKCEQCSSAKQLEVHHKKYIKNREVWDYPRSLLQVLCFSCHKKVHKRSVSICNYHDCESEIESRYEYCFQHYKQSLQDRAKDAEVALQKAQLQRDKFEEARKLAESRLQKAEEKHARQLERLKDKQSDTQSELDRLEKERAKAKEETSKIRRELERKVTSLKNEQQKRVAAQNELLKKKKQKEKVIDEHSAKIIEKAIEREVKEIESKANFEIQKAQAEKEESDQKISSLNQSLVDLQSKIVTANQTLEERRGGLEEALKEEKGKSGKLKEELDELKAQQKKAESTLLQAIETKKRSEKEVEKLRLELEKAIALARKEGSFDTKDSIKSIEKNFQKELAEIEQQANEEILKFKEQEEFSSSRINELSSELTNYKKQISDHGKVLKNAQDEWDRAIASERETSRELELRVGELQVAIKEKDEEIDRLIAIKEREDEMQRKDNKKMISLMVVILISILGLAAIIIKKSDRDSPPPPPPIEDQRQYSHLIKCPDERCSGVMRYISEHNFFGCTNYKSDKKGCPKTLSAPLRCPDHNTTFKTRVENDKGDIKYWVCNRTDICRRNYKYSDIFSNHVICPTPKCGGVLKLKTSSKNPNFKFLGCPNFEENDCEIVNFPLACKKHKVDMEKQERGGRNYWVCKKYDNCRYYHFR